MTYYPNDPGSRAGSPETSPEAAESVAEAARTREAKALVLIRMTGRSGCTADEVADTFEWERYSSRPRLSTLKARGEIVDSGLRRKGASGRNQVVWVVPEYGPPALVGDQGELWGEAA